ncbi:MAG: Multidrug resistance protein NorM [Alphaproteobacteria bacterium MarineAlpha10_Bin3]|nr:MAG: Multidrug resistance protein NorM [Alphaproteobacteria bacterium MarineAlpha10_Bin3]PPR74644.1 MAG: Multidrug resistance protein NorM [Alphaproteobacteria bacterium MarineAlpha4_Bin1]
MSRLSGHLAETIRLAAPVVVTRAGILVMAAVDTAMLGRTDIDQVAFYGIGTAPFIVITITGIGLLFGTLVLTSHAVGREQREEAGPIWRRSLPYALLLGLFGFILCLFGEELFVLTNQPPAIAAGGGGVVAILGLGVPGTLLFTTTAFFLEGMRRPVPAMIVMIAANGLNVVCNWLLIFGHGGFPALGADGAAWATTLVRTAMAAMLIGYVWWMTDRERCAVRTPLGPGWWRRGRAHRRFGLASGASYGIESVAFAAIGFFAGILGALPLAAYTVQHIVFAMVFMIALGIASATSVRVGIAHGRRDWPNRAMAAWSGFGLVILVLGVIGGFFLVFPAPIAAIFTDNARLATATAPLIAFAAFALIFDGGQAVIANALRGAGETWAPTAIHIVSYFVVMIPAGWIFAFTLNHGALGLIGAIIVASAVSVTLLSIRFVAISRQKIKDP